MKLKKMKEEKKRAGHTGNNSSCITKTFTRGRRLNVKVMSVTFLLSFQTECITKDGHQKARISPHFLKCVWISYQPQTLFGVEWHGKIVHGLQDRMCVYGNGCRSVIQQSVAPRQVKTNVAVKWVVPLFLLLKVWWSVIIPKFKKTYFSKLGNILQYTLKLSIPYVFPYSNYFFNVPTKCTYTTIYTYYINTVLHVSALIAPSSGRTLSYAQKYHYTVCVCVCVCFGVKWLLLYISLYQTAALVLSNLYLMFL